MSDAIVFLWVKCFLYSAQPHPSSAWCDNPCDSQRFSFFHLACLQFADSPQVWISACLCAISTWRCLSSIVLVFYSATDINPNFFAGRLFIPHDLSTFWGCVEFVSTGTLAPREVCVKMLHLSLNLLVSSHLQPFWWNPWVIYIAWRLPSLEYCWRKVLTFLVHYHWWARLPLVSWLNGIASSTMWRDHHLLITAPWVPLFQLCEVHVVLLWILCCVLDELVTHSWYVG